MTALWRNHKSWYMYCALMFVFISSSDTITCRIKKHPKLKKKCVQELLHGRLRSVLSFFSKPLVNQFYFNHHQPKFLAKIGIVSFRDQLRHLIGR